MQSIVLFLLWIFHDVILINSEPGAAKLSHPNARRKRESTEPRYNDEMSILEEIHMLENHPVSRLLDRLLLKYDRRLRPHYGGPPVIVNVTMNIDSVGPISEVDMNVRIDISFRQYWMDKRLMFNASDGIDSLTVNSNFLSNIWQPDTYFPDSYESKKQDVMVPNILLRIQPDGLVLYSARVTVIAKCPMNLMYFPMDIQECSLMVETFGYTSRDLILQWKNDDSNHKPVEYDVDNLELAQFKLVDLETKQDFLVFSTGNFSDLEVVFFFKRDLIYFIIQTYVPATLIVLLSWTNFYVNRHSVPARASLAITTVLTMITLMGATNSNLPRVSGIKALDIYFGICFLYVFGALVEFAMVCYFNKPRYQTKPPPPPDKGEPALLGVPWRCEQEKVATSESNGMLIGPADPLSAKNSFAQQNQPPVYSSHLRSTSFQHCDHTFDLPMNHVGTPGGYPPSPCSLRSRKQCSDCSLGITSPATNEAPPSLFSHHPMLGTANGPLSRVNSTSQADFKTVTQNSMLGKPLFDALRSKDGADISLIRNSPEFQQPTRSRHHQRRRRGKHVPRTRNIDVSRIDLYSRIMFPLTYIMICLVYWMVYLGVTDLQDKTKPSGKQPKTSGV